MRKRPGLLLPLLVFGCAGPPTHYYTLASQPPAGPVAQTAGEPIEVSRVILPASLDRLSLVEQAGPDRLIISDQDRWAAPLGGMIRRVLAENLRARLPGSVLLPGDPVPSSSVRGLVVNVRRFIGDTRGSVTLEVDWSLLNAQGQPVGSSKQEAITLRTSAGSPASIVDGMSRALGVLGQRIADKLR